MKFSKINLFITMENLDQKERKLGRMKNKIKAAPINTINEKKIGIIQLFFFFAFLHLPPNYTASLETLTTRFLPLGVDMM